MIPAARGSCPFSGTISRPEASCNPAPSPPQPGPSFSVFSEQLPRRFVERRGGCRILLSRREASPPPNPPPSRGRAPSRDAMLDSGNNVHSQAQPKISLSRLHRIMTLAVVATKPSPLMGEGLGGGDAAQFVGDRLMDAVGICQDLVVPKPQNAIALVLQEPASLSFPRRRAIVLAAVDFQDQPGLVGIQSRQCNDRSALGGGTCTPLFDASAVFAKAAFPPRSCCAVRCELGHVRRRQDVSSCPEFCGGKHHPLPTLPHRGGALQCSAMRMRHRPWIGQCSSCLIGLRRDVVFRAHPGGSERDESCVPGGEPLAVAHRFDPQ
jgi:hypothetical protein